MSFWDDLTGRSAKDAASAAAQDTYAKQQAAAAATRKAGTVYQSGLEGLSQRYDPYVQAGGSALERLLAGLGLGPGSDKFIAAYQATPGYQEGMNTGLQSLDRSANARGMTNSGRTLKDLYRFGSNYENMRSGDYLTRLGGLAGSGLGATQAQVGTAGQGYGGALQADLAAAGQQFGAAPTIGQGQVAGANAMSTGATNLLGAGMKLGGMALGYNPFGGGVSSFGNPSTGSVPGMGSFYPGYSGTPWG